MLVLIFKVDKFCSYMEAAFLNLWLLFIDFGRVRECDTDFALAHEALFAFLFDFLGEIDALIVALCELNR